MWQVAWAHPKFGTLLASCSFDQRVIVWKEVADNVWQPIYQSPAHTASVNSVAWAPYELGLIFAAASSDGSVSVTAYQPDGSWQTEKVRACMLALSGMRLITHYGLHLSLASKSTLPCWCPLLQIEAAHPAGCTSVSWSPAAPKGSLVSSKPPGQPVKRLVTGGCDNCVKVGVGIR